VYIHVHVYIHIYICINPLFKKQIPKLILDGYGTET
jgi:hypothetical protein